MPYIGPDTCTLVIREPATGVDANGQPNRTERLVADVGNSSCTITSMTETRGTATVAVYTLSAALPVTDDTRALSATDAILFDGKTFELTGDAALKTTLRGGEDHMRVFANLEVPIGEAAEVVTITPRFGRDDTGAPVADGAPFDVVARGVAPGASARRLGLVGELDSADFAVALALDVAVKDGDVMTVRGRRGTVRVTVDLEPWAARSQKVVSVTTRRGGAA